MRKVNKTLARKMFNDGKTIYILPCKIPLNNVWVQPYIINKTIANSIYNQTFEVIGFDTIINNFELYNCNYESGYYATYYINENKNKGV